jgi:hypothetical protein
LKEQQLALVSVEEQLTLPMPAALPQGQALG